MSVEGIGRRSLSLWRGRRDSLIEAGAPGEGLRIRLDLRPSPDAPQPCGCRASASPRGRGYAAGLLLFLALGSSIARGNRSSLGDFHSVVSLGWFGQSGNIAPSTSTISKTKHRLL